MQQRAARTSGGRIISAIIASIALAACGSQPAQRSSAGATHYAQPQYGAPQPGYSYPVASPVTNYAQPQPAYTPPPQPQPVHASGEAMFVASKAPLIHAASYIMLDANTGQTIVSHNADAVRGAASTQKILTALVVLDAGNLDKKIRVSSSDIAVEPTRLGVRPGEMYTRRELLYAFLVKSSNDVSNVLARDNAGSISAFAAKMTAKARSLGAAHSVFKNPHGLTAPGQYSSARDMARIAMAAYRSKTIRDIVRRRFYSFRFASGRTVTLENTNEILGRMAECNGMKTGYTNAAGRCLISTAARGGRAVILVQLGTKTKYIWADGQVLMNWGLQRARNGGVAMN